MKHCNSFLTNKCYKYFLFKNHFKDGKKNVFVDDCGALARGSVKYTSYVNENNGFRLRLEKKGVCCAYKRLERTKSYPVYSLSNQQIKQELVELHC